MTTNLERLHDVALHGAGRGGGKTFKRVHDLAAAIELGDRLVLVLITRLNDMKYLRPMVSKVFAERGLPATWRLADRSFDSGPSRVRFITAAEMTRGHVTRGVEYTEVAMGRWD